MGNRWVGGLGIQIQINRQGTGRHERKSLFAFWDRKTKINKFVFGTGAGNTRNHSRSLERDRKNPNFIPVKRDGNGKF